MSATRFAKYVTDPVHDSIGLTQVEVDLIGTSAFQRLRGVKHLGLVHLVYPGADFSRFSHSLGVCHVTGKIIDSLRYYHHVSVSDDEWQLYRLAALLHDVGHYPFSHPMEQALRPYFQEKQAASLVVKGGEVESDSNEESGNDYISHEEISELIITQDPAVKSILDGAKVNPADIASIVRRTKPPQFANLVSSDLDADRIDYMLRTAIHAGLPYGKVDIEYLVRHLTLDKSDVPKLCLPAKALRTAEHFLMARFFEYSQVLVHKTVAGLEQVLKDAIQGLLELGDLDCDRETITKKVQSGEWWAFDDSKLWECLRTRLEKGIDDPVLRRRIECLVQRRPPFLVGELEFFETRGGPNPRKMASQLISSAIPRLAAQLGISEKYFFLWESSKAITKAPASLRYSESVGGAADREKLAQVVHILPTGATESIPITECSYSVMRLIVERPHNLIRLYFVEPKDLQYDRKQLADALKAEVNAEDGWK